MLRCRLKLEGSQTLNSQLFAIKAGIFYSLLYNLISNLSHFWDIRILTGRAVLFGSGWTDTHITDRSQVWTPWQLMCHVKSFLEWETESISSMLKLLCEAAAGMIIWDGSHKDSVQESRWGGPARSPDSHSRNSTAQWLQHNTTQHNTGDTWCLWCTFNTTDSSTLTIHTFRRTLTASHWLTKPLNGTNNCV